VLSDPNPNPSIADDIPIGDDAISDVSNSINPPSSQAPEQTIDNGVIYDGPAVVAPPAAPEALAIEAPPPFHVVPYVEHKHVHIHIPDHHDRYRLPPQGPVVEEPPDNGRPVRDEPHRLENGPERLQLPNIRHVLNNLLPFLPANLKNPIQLPNVTRPLQIQAPSNASERRERRVREQERQHLQIEERPQPLAIEGGKRLAIVGPNQPLAIEAPPEHSQTAHELRGYYLMKIATYEKALNNVQGGSSRRGKDVIKDKIRKLANEIADVTQSQSLHNYVQKPRANYKIIVEKLRNKLG
jgi:hypothetical protein